MLATFVLNALNSGILLGIVAQSRATDLRDRFLSVADPFQSGNKPAADFFDEIANVTNRQGVTVDDQQSRQAFQAAAQFCADQILNPTPNFAQTDGDGVFPLVQDFR